jgi:hypothetical protein
VVLRGEGFNPLLAGGNPYAHTTPAITVSMITIDDLLAPTYDGPPEDLGERLCSWRYPCPTGFLHAYKDS